MIPPLRSILISIWVACVAGAAVIVGLSLGHFTWQMFAISAIVGLVVGVPAALVNWMYLRRNDPPRHRAG